MNAFGRSTAAVGNEFLCFQHFPDMLFSSLLSYCASLAVLHLAFS
tara:strand:+ start:1652 stop:1786 length:135 start_codon:yes stop_codon:yes gene_type:complete